MTAQGAIVACERGPGPFDIGDGDAAEEAGADRREHLRVLQGGEVALLLQLLLGRIHGARHIDGEHQLQIDIDLLRERYARRSAAGAPRRGEGLLSACSPPSAAWNAILNRSRRKFRGATRPVMTNTREVGPAPSRREAERSAGCRQIGRDCSRRSGRRRR